MQPVPAPPTADASLLECMTPSDAARPADRLRIALQSPSSSERLQTALTAGTRPDPSHVDVLVRRCSIEPDFFVRDMLTWALTRHPSSQTVPRLIYEVGADEPQARSQALHTLSKIGDPRGWRAISSELLRDPDDDVARAAWRTAAGLVPPGEEGELAEALCSQLGRGTYDTRRSLSRSIAVLGDAAVGAVDARRDHGRREVRIHAAVTAALLLDPEADVAGLFSEATRRDGDIAR